MASIVSEFMVCQDCAFIIANGEDSCEGPCVHGQGLPAGTVLAGSSVDFHKPWTPCPGCGTALAGEWFEAAELA